MSNSLYSKCRQKIIQAEIDWIDDNIKAALVNGTYIGGSQALDIHEFYTSISDYILTAVAPIKTLTNKVTVVNSVYGAVSADPTIFNSVNPAQTISYIVIFKDPDLNNVNGPPNSNDYGSSPLIALIDSGYGIGAGTNGGNIKITWNPTKGIFKI
jgi:hypothetical protein